MHKSSRPPPRKPAASKPRSAPPSTPRPHTRRAAVARLPARVRAQVEDFLRDGLPYNKIQGWTRAQGHTVSKDALSYWWLHRVTQDEKTRLRSTQGTASALLRKAQDGDATTLHVIRRLLTEALYHRRKEFDALPLAEIIFELRQLERVAPETPTASALDAQLTELLEQEKA